MGLSTKIVMFQTIGKNSWQNSNPNSMRREVISRADTCSFLQRSLANE
jgi:hypothetical protein